MRQRVMIAIALACNPKLIIADEPTTALDVTIQAQILELMKALTRRLDVALIIITHNLGVVARYANRVNVMYAGRIVESGQRRGDLSRPAPSLHDGAAALGAAARPAAPGAPRPGRRPAARPDAARRRLRLPAALPLRRRRAAPRRVRRCEAAGEAGHLAACFRSAELGATRRSRHERRDRRPAPLLEVRGLRMHFPITEGIVLQPQGRRGEGGRRRRLHDRAAARRWAWSARAAAARPRPAAASCGSSSRPPAQILFDGVDIAQHASARSCWRCAGACR